MIVAVGALLLVAAAGKQAQDGGFDAAVRLVGEAQFSRAFAAAEAETDPLRRAQAKVHVLHHGGNLRGALAAALEGLETAPQDAWLLEQAAFVAVSVHEGPLALDLGRKLVAELERTGSDGAALVRARGLRDEAESALARSEERRSALGRARVVALALVLASLLAIAALMRTRPSPPVGPRNEAARVS